MSTLYRDYRPANFSEVFGQNHIKITLQNEIANEKNAHAYLFCGPRAVGKTTIARILAKTINCEALTKGESEPCDKCLSCLSIAKGSNMDVIEIDAASNTGVDNVRENVIASARIAPSKNKNRVFIIDEVHMLSGSAWNALLKILEEPPKNVVFILCTTEIHKVPGTIISRCERFDFKRISVSDIVMKLQNIVSQEKANIDNEVLEAIARQADGHLRDAESLLGQVLSLGSGQITWDVAELIIPKRHHNEIISLLEYINTKDVSKAIKLINELVDSGLNIKNFTGELISVLRKILLNKANPGLAENLGLDLGNNLDLKVASLEQSITLENLSLYLRSFLDIYNYSGSSFIVQLPLEMKVIELCLSSSSMKTDIQEKDQKANNSNVTSTTSTVNASNFKEQVAAKISGAKTTETKKIEPIPVSINEEKTPSINNNGNSVNLSLEEVRNKWSNFLSSLKEKNHSLSFIVQNCQFSEIKDSKLNLTFKYKFHRDRINDQSIKALLEQVLSEIFQAKIFIEANIDENMKIQDSSSTDQSSDVDEVKTDGQENADLNNLLQAFGGELVA